MSAHFTFESLATKCGLKSVPAEWPELWEAFQKSPPDSSFSLDATFVAEVSAFCQFSDEIVSLLQEAASQVRSEPLLETATRFLFAQFHSTPPPDYQTIAAWPFVAQPLDPPASLIPALALLAGIPGIRQDHASRRIPESVTRSTLLDMEVWIRTFHRQHRKWGLSELNWLSHHWNGRLFRIGRMQFMHGNFPDAVRVFKRVTTGQILAFAEPGQTRYRRDGLADGTQDVFDPQAWSPTFEITSTTLSGHPINPLGYVNPKAISLPSSEWIQILAPGDPMLDMHIPEGGAMEFEACGKSLREALLFFDTYFPEKPAAKTFFCKTWFFDWQFQQILPPTSNIVLVQREFYRYPIVSNEKEAFRRIFGGMPVNLHTAPRDTSLRRAMLDFTLAGNHLRCAAGFRLVDAPTWGSAPYQTQPVEFNA
jgi:hypothetical protein